jgi:hypothetical protein
MANNATKFLMDDEDPPTVVSSIADMPREVLSGRLGEICEKNLLTDFPVAFGWPAIVTVASVLAPEQIRSRPSEDDALHNLYTALVGGPNSGKSQAINWAMAALNLHRDGLNHKEVKPGSAERMLKYMNNLHSKGELGERVLMDIDEWSFFFNKAAIENAVFPTLLTTGFYRRNQTILDGHGRPLRVPAAFSWIGGIVDTSYDECFSRVTSLGLHDRFLHGLAPTNFTFQFRPFDGDILDEDFLAKPVQIDGSVYECLKAWRKQNPTAQREAELALRVAYICASFDGQDILRAEDLGPHWILATEQMRLRKKLKPNLGELPDAQCSIKVLNYLHDHGPSGEWVNVRDLMKDIHYERFGPGVFERTLLSQSRLEIIEMGSEPATGKNGAVGRPKKRVRLIL